jgi:site-specific recombinase XerD
MESAWSEYEGAWRRHLYARGRPESTIKTYLKSLHKLMAWAGDRFDDPTAIRPADVEEFLAHLRRTPTHRGAQISDSTIAMDYRHLRVFFNWLADRDDTQSIMRKVSAPTVAEQPADVFSADELRRLIATTKGRDFVPRRDRAILLLFMDTGARRAEIAGLMLDDVDLDHQLIRVTGKGNRVRVIPYGAQAAEAIDNYRLARTKHPDRALPNLWLTAMPHRGALGYDGLGQVLERRGKEAGLTGRVYLHRFRHTAAHLRLSGGMSEGDAMKIFGWKSRSMVDRYGASAAAERAIEAARRSSPIDQILRR